MKDPHSSDLAARRLRNGRPVSWPSRRRSWGRRSCRGVDGRHLSYRRRRRSCRRRPCRRDKSLSSQEAVGKYRPGHKPRHEGRTFRRHGRQQVEGRSTELLPTNLSLEYALEELITWLHFPPPLFGPGGRATLFPPDSLKATRCPSGEHTGKNIVRDGRPAVKGRSGELWPGGRAGDLFPPDRRRTRCPRQETPGKDILRDGRPAVKGGQVPAIPWRSYPVVK